MSAVLTQQWKISTQCNLEFACPDEISRAELVEAWTIAYGHPPPKGLSTRLLRYAYHYNRQAKEYGRLKKSSLHQLMRYLPASPDKEKAMAKALATPKPTAGTRLVREWRGRNHIVDIQEDGFLYQGKSYKSLSAIARTITGARWSGPRFFGA